MVKHAGAEKAPDHARANNKRIAFFVPARIRQLLDFCRGLVVALAAFAVMTGFEMPDLKARSEIQGAVQTADRSAKGDRLPLALAPHEHESVSDAKLPFGCEPLVSPLVSRRLARIAGCVS